MWRTEWEGLHLRRPRVYADRVRLPVYAGRPGDRVRLPVHASHPVDIKLSNFISKQRRYVFTRSEDLPRAQVVWESTTQTNLRKSMWEAWDKATKTTGSRDPRAWMDYGPIWMRRDY
ncbi:hypothetical protein Taro_051670 [Colocasia esculenta]|uniref:Uncharacterized protein n=1 Tax=Colocasia esculenta TaxID=4460 RepID=A0A843XH67_COLES|nr:hypothetical protein [Colocasia esculenta]